jgi:tetratricopeptide (TPR) repeat protein
MPDQLKVPNAVLRRIREHERQESRSEFADALAAKAAEMRISVAPSERYVARLEDGDTRRPHPAYRRVLAAVCGRPFDELGFPAYPGDHGTETLPDSDSLRVPRLAPDAIKSEEMPFYRGSVTDLVAASAEEAANLTMQAGMDSLDPLAVEQYFDEIRRLSVGYISVTPGVNQDVLEKATRLRRELHGLLSRYRRASQSADLYLLQGLLSGICAYASLDLGYPDDAVTQARAAFMMGELAGHDGLRAWALGTRSLIARFQQRYDQALDYARQGIRYATSGTALVRLRCGEGQTLAHLGDADGAVHFLGLAVQAREQVSSPDAMGGLFTFTEAKQAYYSGSSLQWLGGEQNARAAVRESERAIHMFEASDSQSRSLADELLAHVYLANAQLTLNEIEGSMEALRPVLSLSPSERNSWHVMRMRQIAGRLEAGNFARSRLAISARDEILSFTAR